MIPPLWFQSFGTPCKLNHINFNPSFLLGEKQCKDRATTPPLLAKPVLLSHEVTSCPVPRWASIWNGFLQREAKVWHFLSDWCNSGKSSVFVKSKGGKMLYCPQPVPPSAQIIRKPRRRFTWSSDITPVSCNEYVIPLMTGDKTATDIPNWDGVTEGNQLDKSLCSHVNTSGQWRSSWLIHVANSGAVRMSVSLCHTETDAQGGVTGFPELHHKSRQEMFYKKSMCCSEENQPEWPTSPIFLAQQEINTLWLFTFVIENISKWFFKGKDMKWVELIYA